jgi:DNA-binding MarR family transcriptional regulator
MSDKADYLYKHLPRSRDFTISEARRILGVSAADSYVKQLIKRGLVRKVGNLGDTYRVVELPPSASLKPA